MPESFEQNIFDLSVQGIFNFGPDFIIHDRFSAECERIFGESIARKDASSLLFAEKAVAEDFRNGISLVFQGDTKPEVVFDLLESELDIASRKIHIDYRLLAKDSVMVVLTDITRERRFQEISRRDLERRFLVLKAVTHRRYFASFVQESRDLFDTLSLHDNTSDNTFELQEISRAIHTFKGNASFFDFSQSTATANQFESHLDECRAFSAAARIKEFTLALKKAYYQELNYIGDILGQRWISEANGINIPKRDYLLLESWVRKHHSDDTRLIHTLLRYRREAFRESFIRFPELAADLAEKLGKRLHPMIIEGGDFTVIPDRYKQLADAMVHLIRNALDHGIESPAEREKAGKDSAGTLRLQLEQGTNRNFIRVSDDGRGIDPAAVLASAREKGLIDAQQNPPEAQILQLLFHHGFSTVDKANEISGRGVGLNAVKAEIDKIGGTIQIHTRLGRGTTFEISLPNGKKGK